MAVGAQERYAVTWLDAQAEKKPAETADALRELLIGKTNIVADDGGVLRELLFGMAQAAQRRKRYVHGSCCSVARRRPVRAGWDKG